MLTRIFLSIFFLAGALSAQSPPIEPGVSQELAKWRAARYSDIRYKLNLTLEKMALVLKGTLEIRVKVSEPPASVGGQKAGADDRLIILDWRKIKGHEDKSTISNVSVNGKPVSISTNWPPADAGGSDFNEHLIFRDGVVPGENVIKLDFTSPILTSGSSITRYIDKEDGSEYIYSLFVPSDASTAFPVFDQSDLKALFTIGAINLPHDWNVTANMPCHGVWKDNYSNPGKEPPMFRFCDETKPISTYVFAFAAGPFESVSEPPAVAGGLRQSTANATESKTASVGPDSTKANLQPPATADGSDKTPPTSIYVRKSQAAKFKPHAAEVFRLNREAVKYFEQYFDYKFPFPKYDLVLIPEFPFGGMEHAGATFLRESAIIFPQEPTRSDHISRALLIFHEASHQWFGDTVTMRWFDDLWLKEGFATFTAFKALEKIMPEMNSWKIFYERVKQAAYLTDSTRGTTAIYAPVANLSAAKSAYGNIVYNKAPAFLRQAEFYLGEDKFQTAVRAFLKKNEFKNAGWEDLVKSLEKKSKLKLGNWAETWVRRRGLAIFRFGYGGMIFAYTTKGCISTTMLNAQQKSSLQEEFIWPMKANILTRQEARIFRDQKEILEEGQAISLANLGEGVSNAGQFVPVNGHVDDAERLKLIFPNYQDYGYGIFLLDDKSREYVLKNIQNEKDPFLRSMMWGALWDSVREGELDPRVYVELAIKNLPTEADETIVSSILNRVGTAMNYYVSDESRAKLAPRFEALLIDGSQKTSTLGQRITFYRAFLSIAASENARHVLKTMLREGGNLSGSEGAGRDSSPTQRTLPTGRVSAFAQDIPLKTKDRFDIVTRLLILGDADAPKLLADLEKTETSDDAKRYAYAARAGIGTGENKEKYWNDFVNNKDLSESWIEAAFGPWNSIKHSELTLPYLQRALQELPNHKRGRKIFFVNGWLGAFIGGQRSKEALAIVNKFLVDNPKLDSDLQLKVLENIDLIERAVKIRKKFSHE